MSVNLSVQNTNFLEDLQKNYKWFGGVLSRAKVVGNSHDALGQIFPVWLFGCSCLPTMSAEGGPLVVKQSCISVHIVCGQETVETCMHVVGACTPA